MNETLPWPSSLLWMLDDLREETRQTFVETPMEKGPARRRATGTSYIVLAGTVKLGKSSWEALSALPGTAGSFTFPRGRLSFRTIPVRLRTEHEYREDKLIKSCEIVQVELRFDKTE